MPITTKFFRSTFLNNSPVQTGKMTVTGGLTLMQQAFTHLAHFFPKKMLMKQICDMQQLKQ